MKQDPRERRKITDQRRIERREPKRGVNVRVNDKDGEKPKRVRRAEHERTKNS